MQEHPGFDPCRIQTGTTTQAHDLNMIGYKENPLLMGPSSRNASTRSAL
jgi:hypothetical protein